LKVGIYIFSQICRVKIVISLSYSDFEIQVGLY